MHTHAHWRWAATPPAATPPPKGNPERADDEGTTARWQLAVVRLSVSTQAVTLPPMVPSGRAILPRFITHGPRKHRDAVTPVADDGAARWGGDVVSAPTHSPEFDRVDAHGEHAPVHLLLPFWSHLRRWWRNGSIAEGNRLILAMGQAHRSIWSFGVAVLNLSVHGSTT